MSTLIKFIGIPVLAVGFLLAADAPTADAGHGHSYWGGGGGHYHQSHRPSYGYRYAPRVQYRAYYGGNYGRRYFHDTTHLDYHAPSVVPHNGHLDYVPGHYDVHRSGHWH